MYYKKLTSGPTIIEFHNNWLGEETVIVNGQIMSKKFSVFGKSHYFKVMEDGHQIRYILTTKIDAAMQVLIDLSRNGELILENVVISLGSKAKKPKVKEKTKGLALLREYELEEAITEFKKALEWSPKDPEIYFHMACAYSLLEKTQEGFECLKKAAANNLQDQEMIFNHDMLAYVRMHDAFEDFANSGFVKYDEELFKD